MKKVISFILVLLVLSTTSTFVYADNHTIPINVTAEEPVMSVTVPTEFPVYISNLGVVTTATDLGIINNSSGQVVVTGVEVTPSDSWRIFPYAEDRTKFERSFAMRINNMTTPLEFNQDEWAPIDGNGGKQPIMYDIKIAPLGSEVTNIGIGSITFTIDWKKDDLSPIAIGTKHSDGIYEYSYKQIYSYSSNSWVDADEDESHWGVRVLDTSITEYKQPLKDIQGYVVNRYDNLFQGSKVPSIDISTWDLSKVYSINGMFMNSLATEINVSGIKTSSVVLMKDVFKKSNASSIDISSWDTSKVSSTSGMFQDCVSSTIKLPTNGFSRVYDASYMFSGIKVSTLDVSMNTPMLTVTDNMFSNTVITDYLAFGLEFKMDKTISSKSMFDNSTIMCKEGLVLKTPLLRDASSMYNKASIQGKLPITIVDTYSLRDSSSMFRSMKYSGDLDVSGLNVYYLENAQSMFEFCTSPTITGTDNWETKSISSTMNMFSNTNITYLNLCEFDITTIRTAVDMFRGTPIVTGHAKTKKEVDYFNALIGKEVFTLCPDKVTTESLQGKLN